MRGTKAGYCYFPHCKAWFCLWYQMTEREKKGTAVVGIWCGRGQLTWCDLVEQRFDHTYRLYMRAYAKENNVFRTMPLCSGTRCYVEFLTGSYL